MRARQRGHVLLCVGALTACVDGLMIEPEPRDAGSVAFEDAGAVQVDAGTMPSVDAGTPPIVDAGTPIVDAGQPPAPSDGGDFFGAPRCAAGAFKVCDSFEGTAFDPALWTYYPPQAGATGYAAIDGTQSARGASSLHLHSGVQVTAKDSWPWLANGFHLRAFMRWAQPVDDWHKTYFWVIDPAVGGAFTLGSYHGQLGINEYGPNNGDTGVAARDNLPLNRWACVEWQVNPANNEVHVWVDGAEVPAEAQNPFHVPNMHVTNWPPMNWKSFTIEFITAKPTDDMWIDELAIDANRIGCAR